MNTLTSPYIVRKHWITYIPFTLLHAITFCIVGFVVIPEDVVYNLVAGFAWLTLTSYVWFFILQYLDCWIVNDEEIIAVDQVELFSRSESHIMIGRIQDVQWRKEGILQELLGYGTLTVQSAGEEREFVMEDVAHVEEVSAMIMVYKKGSPMAPSLV